MAMQVVITVAQTVQLRFLHKYANGVGTWQGGLRYADLNAHTSKLSRRRSLKKFFDNQEFLKLPLVWARTLSELRDGRGR